MNHEFIQVERDHGVAIVTLNRPDVLNSFNRGLARELQAALANAANDESVRAVLLIGSGRGFCAGQDLGEALGAGTKADLGEIVKTVYTPIVRAIREMEKPVVCAVNGVAAGAGANLAFACDIVIAAEDASFIQSFSKIGLIPDTGGTFFLPRLVGAARATALMLLGEKLTATKALEWGLIHDVVPGTVLRDTALALTRHLATMPTRALALTKKLLNASASNALSEQLAMEEEMQRQAGRTADYAEGVSAFLQKRKPSYTGR
ncbi:MAG TPA: 2-(1,2-epoxy-1,2-dihydrophenyl)acetyl-CoA isomerase PaaG [Gemmatimonadaceae bacterium]|nr:2-(1,2-epoxy-1,2-dihydrophenyl)acetyl-CoA isomerase PaaG [Gemmatimonadaceae bacterium]